MKKLLLILLATTIYAFAAPFAVINKLEGTAKVQHKDSIKKSKLKVGNTLSQGDTVLTYRNAKLVLTMRDKTKIVVNAYAKLQLLTDDEYAQSGGKIFFKVTKRKGGKGLKVKTPFAIIGVKGTQFVVTDSDKDKSLALKEGLVGVDNPHDQEFALLDKEKLDAALGNTAGGEMAEFEQYKKELMKEFTEYKKSFDLHPGKKLSFNGNAVSQSSIDSSDDAMFKDFAHDAEFQAISSELEEMSSDIKTEDELMLDTFFTDDEK